MSLAPPSLWTEKRGHQHRVYRRNAGPGTPARDRRVRRRHVDPIS